MMEPVGGDENRRLAETIAREEGRLRGFIRRSVPDPADVDDILQDVFYELVAASRLATPIENVGAWLFRVARNRVTDLFRRKKPEPFPVGNGEDGASLEDLLPSPDAGPDAAFARALLLDELADAIDELPEAQRRVFLAQEVEGRSFRELAVETGIGINTLLSRKRYAVLHLRRRLETIYNEYRKG
jgi:RNA polymerase sigma factor (sigma-70 family)